MIDLPARTTPMNIPVPAGWSVLPAWMVLSPVKRKGHVHETVLSVYREYGVIPKSSRDDNHNRTPENLDSYQLVEPGDVVFNKMKAWSGSVGVSQHRGIVSGDYLVCRTDQRSVDRRFLHYLLRSRPFFAEYAKRSTGIRPSQWRLYWEELSRLDLPLPGIDEQRRLADRLDAEVTRIDQTQQHLRRLKEFGEERFRAAATAAIFGADSGGCGWHSASPHRLRPYQWLAATGSGHTPSRSVAEYWTDCDIPWVTTADVSRVRADLVEGLSDTEHHINALGMANSSACLHAPGTVFFSRTASVGFSGVMEQAMATSQDFFTWTCGDHLHNRFLLWSLRSMRWAGVFDRLMFGSTHNTIYVPDLMSLRGPVPLLADQLRSVDQIDEVQQTRLRLRQAVDHQVELLDEHKRALIAAAVTGQITV